MTFSHIAIQMIEKVAKGLTMVKLAVNSARSSFLYD